MDLIKLCLISTVLIQSYAISDYEKAVRHVARRRAEGRRNARAVNGRRFSFGDQDILGAPSRPSHLPSSEPILPGHTLIRPSLGMLKSAVKFPHRELEDGSGVYGNIDTIGIRYNGNQDRLMYSKFRRMPTRRNLFVVLPDRYKTDQRETLTIGDYIKSYRRIHQDEALGTENQEESSRTKLFWSTKNAFNHIKVNPDAPEYNELMPANGLEEVRDWWFYHEMDFKEFGGRES